LVSFSNSLHEARLPAAQSLLDGGRAEYDGRRVVPSLSFRGSEMSVAVAAWTADRVCEGGIAPPQQPRLLDRVRAAIRARHYSVRTEKAYVHWIRRYILFHGKRHPESLGAPEIEAFRSALAVQGRVPASTGNQALAALLFLYREVLRIELPWIDGIVRAKTPGRLPAVLSRDEVALVLGHMRGVPLVMATLLYAPDFGCSSARGCV
jgi:hypothetical protein